MLFKAITFPFLLATLFSPAYAENQLAVCEASSRDCQMYSCMEEHFQCGRKAYLIKFGKKYCERYLQYQDTSTSRLQAWYPKVRFCLQSRLAEIGDASINTGKKCKNLEEMAFRSHVDCYVETGFCDLGILDKLEVAAVAGLSLLAEQSQKTELAVQSACLKLHKLP